MLIRVAECLALFFYRIYCVHQWTQRVYKERVGTVELPPTEEVPARAEPSQWPVPRSGSVEKRGSGDTEGDVGSSDEEPSQPGTGSDADDESEPEPSPAPAPAAGRRIRCVVKGVDGGPDREVWLDV